jgi:hypothetical protein
MELVELPLGSWCGTPSMGGRIAGIHFEDSDRFVFKARKIIARGALFARAE